MFPADNIWHADVSGLPVHPKSNQYVTSIGVSSHAKADFGSGLWDGGPIGIPYDVVGAGQRTTSVTFDYDEDSDHVPYPIPANPSIEGGPNSSGDRHVLIVDNSSCTLYELYAAYPNGNGTWHAGSGAVWNLNSNALRTDTYTSADAAGLPILPGTRAVRRGRQRAHRSRHPSDRTAQRPQLSVARAPPSRRLELEPAADGSSPPAQARGRRLLVPTRRPSDLAGDEDLRRDRRGQRLAVVHVRRPRRALEQRRAPAARQRARLRLRGGRRNRADGGRQLRPGRRRRSHHRPTTLRGADLTAVLRRNPEPATNHEHVRGRLHRRRLPR